MPRKELFTLTGGLVDADSGRADQLADDQVQKSDNYEIIGDGSRLTIRKDQQEHGTGKSGNDLNVVLASLFATEVITFSDPYYPPKKPTGMTGDFILLVFGNDGGTYKLYAIWETSTTYNSSQVTITGVAYTSSSDMKFFVGDDRIIITDYINRAHYYRIDNEGSELSGVMGIPAPLNPASFTQLTSFNDTDFETNVGNVKLSSPGLVQVVYVAVTERGEMSNPSPISNTLRIQRFNLDSSGADEKWIDKVLISNLSIPVTGSGSDIEEQLKWFDIYLRVMRYSEDSPENFEFSERVLINDKSNTSGDTGNDYSLTIPVTLGQTPNSENDVAPVAKLAAQVGGVIALAGIKSKITFPFEFSRYKEIIIQNKDGKSYVDAVVKLRLFDEDSSDSNKISDLNWTDYDTNGDDDIDSGNRDKIRFYDDDLRTALNVVYTLDTSADWCDVYIKIPLLIPGNHVIYLCFGDGSELSSMAGVDDTDMQTIPNGRWHHAGVTSWAGQTVFQPEMVKSSSSIVCAPLDFQSEISRMPNLVNEDNDANLQTDISFSITPIAAIPDLGDTFIVGTGSLKVGSTNGLFNFAGKVSITAQADGGSGLVRHTSVGHSLKVGDIVEISQTTSYNGIFEVISVIVDNFDLEQTWVANDASGNWTRGFEPFPARGYLYTRIAYAGSDVTVDKQIFAVNKADNLLLRIEATGWFWKITTNAGSNDFTKIASPANNSGTGKYFILMSWDTIDGTVSVFVYDMTNGTLEFEEQSIASTVDQNATIFFGAAGLSINNAKYSQLQYIKGRYLDAGVLADVNTVRNIGNFRPAFEQMIGEALGADNVDDGVMNVVVGNNFAGDNWTTGSTWDVNTTTANKAHAFSGSGSTLQQTNTSIVAGVKYLTKYTISGFASNTVKINVGGVDGTVRSANGTYTEIITASDTTSLRFITTSGTVLDIDDVSCYPLIFNNNVDYSNAVKVIELKEQGNLLKWSAVNGIAFPDLNFKFLREPIKEIIPAPSFLKFNYENTFVIFMRNFINRFVLDGDPSLLAARSDVLIEERTNFGLQYTNSLARTGEDLFWKSEAGIIHWSPDGLLLISDGVISIADIGGSGDMFGFYSPIRNQYLLHNRALNTYVYDIKRKVFTRFIGFDMKTKPVTLTAGLEADNVNIFLDVSSNVDEYPGSTDTTVASEIRTKEFFMGKGLLDKIMGDYSELAGTVLSVVVKNVDYAGGEKETTLTKEPLVWRHIDLAKKRGRSFYIKLKNVTDFSYFRIKFRNIGGRD